MMVYITFVLLFLCEIEYHHLKKKKNLQIQTRVDAISVWRCDRSDDSDALHDNIAV